MTKMNRLAAALIAALILPTAHAAQQQDIDAVIQPLMKKYGVPGMAIAVSVDGKQQIYPYGVASKQTGKPITEQTLFEVGSLSKTFTATLAVYAQQQGKLSFNDPASRYLPELRGSAFDGVSLLNLATHTSGLPLFVPDDVTDNAQLMAYYRAWQPKHPAGSYRVYSNLGIGMLGMIAAKSLDQPFTQAMEQGMLPALGMRHTYVQVPAAQMTNYAQGYNKDDKPVRVNPGPLDAESYGIKSNARDLIRYLDANLQQVKVAQPWREALTATHVGYYKAGAFTQDLMWENYPYPVKLSRLIEGNNAGMIMNGTPATAITPPQPELRAGWYNKTGSTGGFSTYAVFIPAKNIAVVMLANKWFPNDDRVEAAYRIVQALDKR
ncbi:SRT/SST family class C beta-lactamase [Serratia marcescens]|uniref:SRT/SST family class C beta-lactamase n=1 Tax=Serratia marcescens TaxID=615 RepID=UPI001D923671|nr:SRT/SST family class C beta-lactamase [Serratia marcescens]MBN5249098.1 SRT/SST family class C beta-lactamase [Serratia marcescens]MBN5257747.1 SRT/SST family class C beta-lactamase [Serratia marcescens]MBN5352262.1 SRT/SST family class C beta-lactamase [Serratia marcescens]MCW6024228.1 SRT/SST family class C beta-lactamase [Serratia marcescens]MEE4610739.1 SRT/SST family class C beta-lactamase [Serratia marcescens]